MAKNKKWNWLKNDTSSKSKREQGSPTRQQQSGGNSAPSLYSMPLFPALSALYQPMEFWNNTLRSLGMPSLFSGLSNEMAMFNPNIDIAASNEEYTITVEAPGIDENGLHIEVSRDGKLVIQGEKQQESENQNRRFHRVESSYGSFERILSLPEDVDQENISAESRNGVLTITLPRMTQKSGKRQIAIQSSAQNQNRSSGSSARSNAQSASTSGRSSQSSAPSSSRQTSAGSRSATTGSSRSTSSSARSSSPSSARNASASSTRSTSSRTSAKAKNSPKSTTQNSSRKSNDNQSAGTHEAASANGRDTSRPAAATANAAKPADQARRASTAA